MTNKQIQTFCKGRWRLSTEFNENASIFFVVLKRGSQDNRGKMRTKEIDIINYPQEGPSLSLYSHRKRIKEIDDPEQVKTILALVCHRLKMKQELTKLALRGNQEARIIMRLIEPGGKA